MTAYERLVESLRETIRDLERQVVQQGNCTSPVVHTNATPVHKSVTAGTMTGCVEFRRTRRPGGASCDGAWMEAIGSLDMERRALLLLRVDEGAPHSNEGPLDALKLVSCTVEWIAHSTLCITNTASGSEVYLRTACTADAQLWYDAVLEVRCDKENAATPIVRTDHK